MTRRLLFGVKLGLLIALFAFVQSCKKEDEKIAVTAINFTETTMNITVGEEKAITFSVLPENATDPSLTWASSDKDVASVEEGKVTAVKPGVTVITATSVDNKSVTKKMTVTVKSNISLAFEEESYSVEEKSTINITPTILPTGSEPELRWSYADDKDAASATINETTGEITGNSEGSGVVTVTLVEDPTVTATFKLTVTAEPIVLSFENSDYTLEVGKNLSVPVVIYPEDASPELVWSYEGTGATIDASTGEITGVSEGTGVVTVKMSGDDAVKATFNLSVIVLGPLFTLPAEMGLAVGEEHQMEVTYRSDIVDPLPIMWTVYDTNPVPGSTPVSISVTRSGMLTANYPGNFAYVIATYADETSGETILSDTTHVIVASVEATAIHYAKDVVTIKVGESYNFDAENVSFTPENTSIRDYSITAQSSATGLDVIALNDGIGATNITGLTGMSPGEATVQLFSKYNPEITTNVKIIVEKLDDALTGYDLTFESENSGETLTNPEEFVIEAGKVFSIEATNVNTEVPILNYAATIKTTSSDLEILTLEPMPSRIQNTFVTAIKPGVAYVEYEIEGIKKSVKIVVIEAGKLTDFKPVWGSTSYYDQENDVEVIGESEVTIKVGERDFISIKNLIPEDFYTEEQPVITFEDPTIAVLRTGSATTVRAAKVGTTKGTVSYAGLEREVTLTVVDNPDFVQLESFELVTDTTTVEIDPANGYQVVYVNAEYPLDPMPTNTDFTWSVDNESIATINMYHDRVELRELKEGTVTVTATSVSNPSLSKSITLTFVGSGVVVEPAIKLPADDEFVLWLDETKTMEVTFGPNVSEDPEDRRIQWSFTDSDPLATQQGVPAISINRNTGAITANRISPGEIHVTALHISTGVTATTRIVLKQIELESISYSEKNITVEAGSEYEFLLDNITFTPENVSNKDFNIAVNTNYESTGSVSLWESQDNAEVPKPIIYGQIPGTTQILLQSGYDKNIADIITVTVTKNTEPFEGFSYFWDQAIGDGTQVENATELTMSAESGHTLELEHTNATVDILGYDISYSSSDETVATIAPSQGIRGDLLTIHSLKEGTTTITITVEGESKSFTLTVGAVATITDYTPLWSDKSTSISVMKGKTNYISIDPDSYLPEGKFPNDSKPTITIKDETIAKFVPGSETIRAYAVGTTEVEVKLDNIVKTLTFTSTENPEYVEITEIDLSSVKTTYEFDPEKQFNNLSVYPSFGTTSPTVTDLAYTISDETVATITKMDYGNSPRIKILKAGTFTLTATSLADPTVMASVMITVTEKGATGIQDFNVTFQGSSSVTEGSSIMGEITGVLPEGYVSLAPPVVETSTPEIIEVSYNSMLMTPIMVKGLKAGTGKLDITIDGKKKTFDVVVDAPAAIESFEIEFISGNKVVEGDVIYAKTANFVPANYTIKNPIEYSTDNADVATISHNMFDPSNPIIINGKAVGKANVSVIIDGLTITTEVEVVAKPNVDKPDSFTFEFQNSATSVDMGQTVTATIKDYLPFGYEPKSVSVTTSTPELVDVTAHDANSYIIKGLKDGTAKIDVNVDGTVMSYDLVVNYVQPILVESIELNNHGMTNIELTVNSPNSFDREFPLSATILPAGAFNTILNYTATPEGIVEIVEMHGGMYAVAKAQGTCVVTATSTDGSNIVSNELNFTVSPGITLEGVEVMVGETYNSPLMPLDSMTIDVEYEVTINFIPSNYIPSSGLASIASSSDNVTVRTGLPGQTFITATAAGAGYVNVLVDGTEHRVDFVIPEEVTLIETIEITTGQGTEVTLLKNEFVSDNEGIITTINPEEAKLNEVSFTSSNESVARVVHMPGRFTYIAAEGVGTCTIECKSMDGTEVVSNKITVTVVDKVVLTDYTLGYSESMFGSFDDLEGTDIPTGVSYEVSLINAVPSSFDLNNTANGVEIIETSDNITLSGEFSGFTLTANAGGAAYIKANVDGLEKTINFNVSEQAALIESISIALRNGGTSHTFTVGDTFPQEVQATIAPSNADVSKVRYVSSDESVATVALEMGRYMNIRAVGAGSCTITAETTDGSNLVSNAIEITVLPEEEVTIDNYEVGYETSFNVFDGDLNSMVVGETYYIGSSFFYGKDYDANTNGVRLEIVSGDGSVMNEGTYTTFTPNATGEFKLNIILGELINDVHTRTFTFTVN